MADPQPKVVCERLGHAGIGITPGMQEAEKLDAGLRTGSLLPDRGL